MTEMQPSTPHYILRQASDSEDAQRLQLQSRMLNPFTRRLLADIGVSRGMRVLDIGCGAGDLSLLAAEAVGEEGCILGVDSNADAIALAQARIEEVGFSQVSFQVADIHNLASTQQFDAIIGRLILQHVPDPEALLTYLLTHLRKGGLVAFQEFDLVSQADANMPASPLWGQVMEWTREAFRRSGVETRMGMKLFSTFVAAGLPAPQLRYEAAIGAGPGWEGYEILAAAIRAFMPAILKFGIATAEEIGIETLLERLHEESQGGVTRYIGLVSAWARTGLS
jgi:ubiquinone/menaquinone biosynthesis C-methylase UbiE